MKLVVFLCCQFLLVYNVFSQTNTLEEKIQSIINDKRASVGVAVIFNGQDSLAINNQRHYPMLSTFKFPVALSVLNHLDKKKLSLDTELYIRKSDLLPDTYSPLRDARPEGNFKMSVGDLIKYTVSLSDNNTCDILIRYVGGVKAVQQYINKIGLRDMTIVADEELMHKKTKNQYLNKTTPLAGVKLLELFLKKELLSDTYQTFLENTMIETTTGIDKIKGLLPKDLPVGHKTGSSDRDKSGLKIADNDMGFVYLPNGKYYTIAVFVTDSMEDDRTNATIIAQISKVIYDHYQAQ